MDWLFFSLVALFCFVGYDLLARVLGVNSANPRAFAVIYNSIAVLLTPVLLLVEPLAIKPLSAGIILLTLISLTVWGLFGRFEYYTHKHVEASILTIVFRLGPALAFVYAVLFLKEPFSVRKALGMILILAANYWLYIVTRASRPVNLKGIKYAFLITFLASIGFIFDKVVSPSYGLFIFTLLSFTSPVIFSYFGPQLTGADLKREISVTRMSRVLLLAAINVVGYGCLVKALIIGEASRVVPVATATTPFIVLFGVVLLKEKSHLPVKAAAAALTLAAIYLMR